MRAALRCVRLQHRDADRARPRPARSPRHSAPRAPAPRRAAASTGWGACQPPSPNDVPDPGYVDSNCDGIDGDASKGIFVAGGGTNSSTCGLAYNSPCQTISFGIMRGVQTSRPNVYVQTGTYNEVIVMQSGVNVWGGYDFNWQRGPYSNAANRVTVNGAQDTTTGGDGEYLTVRAHDLIVPVDDRQHGVGRPGRAGPRRQQRSRRSLELRRPRQGRERDALACGSAGRRRRTRWQRHGGQ